MKRITKGKVYCVAATGDMTHQERHKIGRVLEKSCHVPVISAPHVHESQQLELAHQILDGFETPSKAQIIPNRVGAIEWALEHAAPGDCVVVTGYGEQPVCSLDDGRWQLTDREICQAWLYDHPVSPLSESPKNKRIFRIDDFRC